MESLNYYISVLENFEKHHRDFYNLVKAYIIANYLRVELWGNGHIEDNEFLSISERIDQAFKNAVKSHKKLVVERLRKLNVTDIETAVSMIYNDILG